MPGHRRSRRRAGIGLVVSVALLWWALHDVSFSEVAALLAAADWPLFLAAVVLVAVTHYLRAVRWRLTLRPAGRLLPVAPLFYATAVGTMANNLLPARAGELVRSYAARTLTRAPFTTAVASLVVERVMDGVALLILLLLGLLVGDYSEDARVGGVTLGGFAAGVAVIFGLALVLALAVVFRPKLAARVAERTVFRLLPASLGATCSHLFQQFVEGLDSLRSRSRTAGVLVWSLVIWSINALAIWLGLAAFSISVSWTAPLLIQAVIALGVALPSSPGFFGPFEAASRAALALFGVDATRAAAFAVPFHVGVYFLPIIVLGTWSLWRTKLDLAVLRIR